MTNDRRPPWRAWVALLFVAAVLIAFFVLLRPDTPQATPKPDSSPINHVGMSRPSVTQPLSPLSRADLLDAAARAASAYAAGEPPPSENLALAGRSFILRLPFGCTGPVEAGQYLETLVGSMTARRTPFARR